VGTARGGSFYDLAGVGQRYLAHHDGRRFSPNHVMEDPAVLAEVGDPAGLRVIDLGCGDGRFGRELIAAGCADYLGIDGSATMVELARRELTGLRARVELADLEAFTVPPDCADLVTARLSLHYVADLVAVLRAVARALRPGGRFVMTVVHPVITSHDNPSDQPRTTWTVDDYFRPGPRTRIWFGSEVTWHHRTVEQYAAALVESGLSLTTIGECPPLAERFDGDDAELARRMRVPLFLLLAARA
jgi:SAM-dependent methyltransferase